MKRFSSQPLIAKGEKPFLVTCMFCHSVTLLGRQLVGLSVRQAVRIRAERLTCITASVHPHANDTVVDTALFV